MARPKTKKPLNLTIDRQVILAAKIEAQRREHGLSQIVEALLKNWLIDRGIDWRTIGTDHAD